MCHLFRGETLLTARRHDRAASEDGPMRGVYRRFRESDRSSNAHNDIATRKKEPLINERHRYTRLYIIQSSTNMDGTSVITCVVIVIRVVTMGFTRTQQYHHPPIVAHSVIVSPVPRTPHVYTADDSQLHHIAHHPPP